MSNYVDLKIKNKKVVVFGKTTCPHCAKAKSCIEKYIGKQLQRDDYEVIDLDLRDDCAEIQDYLKTITGARTVPRVFIKGKCLGGGDETQRAHSNGQLAKLLE